MNPTLTLKPNREKSLLRRHPWIFSGAIAHLTGAPALGETVAVHRADGQFLCWAAYSPHSQIRGRVWSWSADDAPSPGFFRARLAQAIAARQNLLGDSANAFRLVHAESDGLPGLIVDRYGDTLVMQCLSAGAEHWRDTLADLLLELTGAARIFERSDADVRKLEGLPPRTGILRGGAPPRPLKIVENGLTFLVDVHTGHKTGFYLDQRDNRALVRALAKGRAVLSCFSYTGSFGVCALAGGADSVVSIDTSAHALALAGENLAANGLPDERATRLEGDVFYELRKCRDSRQTFDLIILDPPKFAPTAKQARKAARGYKDINLLAFKLLRPGGLLVTFSCSGGVSAELFQKIVAGASLDAGVEAQIVGRLGQGADHPVALNFPEGAYLKGLVVLVGSG